MNDAFAGLLADADLAEVLRTLPQARIVGGAVRDALAGRSVADIDLATPDPPETTMALLRAAGIRAIPTGLSHGTVTAVLNQRSFEITTLRRDLATDGRHAAVAWTTDWQADAARRDFTINALSLDRAATLHDYFGGRADLAAGRVRFVGDPATRIAEDYLRILRYFRFHARYGGTADADAAAAIRAAVPGLATLSVERVWSELKRILEARDPRAAIALMDELGVLAAIMPEGTNTAALAALIARDAPADPLLRVAALLTGSTAALADRLKLSTAERDTLIAAHATPTPTPASSDADLRRLLADYDTAPLLARTWLAGDNTADWQNLRARLEKTPRPSFPLEGRDALALGAQPGPTIGAALKRTRDWWLKQGCDTSHARLADILRGALEEEGQGALPPGPPLGTSPQTPFT